MKRIFGKFLVFFALGTGCFLTSACSGAKLVWCTSNGIVTYNRHTGQFEMLWENQAKQVEIVHDTVYIFKGTQLEKDSINF